MHTPYTQCYHCHKWLRLDQSHITATVSTDDATSDVHLHDEMCLRYTMVCHRVTNIQRVPAVIYQD